MNVKDTDLRLIRALHEGTHLTDKELRRVKNLLKLLSNEADRRIN